jgi:transposase InsO family protein
MNWNVIYAHAWPDNLYDATVRYIQNGTLDPALPDHIKKTFRRRARAGYSVNENGQLVLKVDVAPWNVNRKGTLVTVNPQPFTFTVVKASGRTDVIRRFMSDMRNVATNAHMLVDRLHREGYLGISRRFLHHFLQTDPSMIALRVQSQPNPQTVVKSFRPSYPFEHWQIDTMDMTGPNNTYVRLNKGYKYVLVIIDIFTKFVYLFPMSNKLSENVAQILNKLFLSGDIPDKLHSDNGVEFKGSVSVVCREFKVKQIFGRKYSPQTQGFVENKNKQIKKLINYYMMNTGGKKYYEILDQVAYTINNSKHGVTGFTPMQLHKGRATERTYTLTTEQDEDFETLFEEPTNADLENYFHQQNRVYDTRVRHIKNTLKGVATKRDQKRAAVTSNIRTGSYVKVMTHVVSGPTLVGTFIRVGDTLIRNPLRGTFGGVFKHISDKIKYPLSLFTPSDLTGPSKTYDMVFRVSRVIQNARAATQYHIESTTTTTPVWVQAENRGEFVREFYKENLVLFDLNHDPAARTNLQQMRPNPLYIDLHKPLRTATDALNDEYNEYNEHTAVATQNTNQIRYILARRDLLNKEKPLLFITMQKNGDDVPFVYVAKLLSVSPQARFVLQLDKDPEDPTNKSSISLRLEPGLYNLMHEIWGWRFMNHNHWLLRDDLGAGTKTEAGHFAMPIPDVALIPYKDVLTDPSYTIQELFNYPFNKHAIRIRYAVSTNNNGIQTGTLLRPMKRRVKQQSMHWKVEFNDGRSEVLTLNSATYGHLMFQDGWEFVDFNSIFNIHLQDSINKLL